MTIEIFLRRLEGVRREGAGWKARCPAHPDSDPSLHIDRGENGGIALHDFGGCSPEAIVAAAGLSLADLMPEKCSTVRRFAGAALASGRQRQVEKTRDAAQLWLRLARRDSAGEAYLDGRALWDESLPGAGVLRFNTGTSFDLWLDARAHEGFRVAFPVRRPDGSIANLSLRRVGGSGAFKKTLVLAGCSTTGVAICRPEILHLMSGDSEFEHDEVEICEGGSDFLALTLAASVSFAEGCTPPRWALGVIGASNAAGVVEAFTPMIRGRTVRLALDPDEAGEKAAAEAAQAAYRVGARQVIRVRPRGAKDFAELWAGTGA